MGEFSIFHWLVVLAIVLLLVFGKRVFPVPAALVVARPHIPFRPLALRNFSIAEES